MQFQFEKMDSELTELSDYLDEHKDDSMLALLNDKLSDSLVAIFVVLAQLKPSYKLKFSAIDRQEKQQDLLAEIALVCQECKASCVMNQFIAEKIDKIEALLLSCNPEVKNAATL